MTKDVYHLTQEGIDRVKARTDLTEAQKAELIARIQRNYRAIHPSSKVVPS